MSERRYGLLDRIREPRDLRSLSADNLTELCAEIREFLIDSVSQTGGHLASNLGVVELTVAMQLAFDTEKDRIVFDVGHQCYTHKLLTGRREDFAHLRQFGGMAGFTKPEESVHDACISGHASNSVSVALGMAHARTLRHQHYHVVAVIGDGALTGGMAYEGLNAAGASGEPMIIILNDNNMSIARNVGAMSRHLSQLRVKPRYLRMKKDLKSAFQHVPGGGSAVDIMKRAKRAVKSIMLPSSMFEQMGLNFLGPVDGHDIQALCRTFELAKTMKKPVVIHVMTKKGRGYPFAEKNPQKYHGISKFDPKTGLALSKPGKNFSTVFGEAMIELAEQDERICAVTAAMPSGTGLSGFASRFPERFFDVGIAEEHAAAMAAGMAKQGLKPVFAVYSTFLQRSYDQLIHDVAIDRIPAVFAIDRAGIVGDDGPTHNGVFDVGFLRQIPGFTLYAPSNFAELRSMLKKALYETDGPAAVRYPRGGQGAFVKDTSQQDCVCLRDGGDVVLVSYGIMIQQALDAAEQLAAQGIDAAVYKLNCLTGPFSAELLDEVQRA
ncbi:MAG: 1-deoxy-D-xylulose-5-phosphate synthase, partial [Butyricicoccaceae bacterium]